MQPTPLLMKVDHAGSVANCRDIVQDLFPMPVAPVKGALSRSWVSESTASTM